MKIFFLILVLTSVISCKSSIFNREIEYTCKRVPIKIDFNKDEFSVFGVPTKNLSMEGLFVRPCRNLYKIESDSMSFSLTMLNRRSALIEYSENNYKTSGEVLFLSNSSIGFTEVIDLETLETDTLKTYLFIEPIKKGRWVFEEKGKIRTREYNQVILHID